MTMKGCQVQRTFICNREIIIISFRWKLYYYSKMKAVLLLVLSIIVAIHAADQVVVTFTKGTGCPVDGTQDQNSCIQWVSGSSTVPISDGSNADWEFTTTTSKLANGTVTVYGGFTALFLTSDGSYSALLDHVSPGPGFDDVIEGDGPTDQVMLDNQGENATAYYTFAITCSDCGAASLISISYALVILMLILSVTQYV